MFFAAGWCGDACAEDRLKKESGLTIRCIPFELASGDPTCFFTGRKSDEQAIVAKAY